MQSNYFRPVNIAPAILSGTMGDRVERALLELHIRAVLWPGMETLDLASRLVLPGVTVDVSIEFPTSGLYELYDQLLKVRQSAEIPDTLVHLGALSSQLFVPPLRGREMLGVYGTLKPGRYLGEKCVSARSSLDRKAMWLVKSPTYPFTIEFAFLFHTVDPPELDIFIEGLTDQIRAIDELKENQA